MAGPTESGASPGDRYASNKANLRETIKWLAGIFGALAAVVIGGTPLSGLGALPLDGVRLWVAGATLITAFTCICLALVITMRLLRSDLLYLSDINPSVPTGGRVDASEIEALRQDIEAHRIDLFPEYHSLRQLFETVAEADATAVRLEARWRELLAAKPCDQAAVDATKKQYDEQIAALKEFRLLQQNLLAYASYQRFYGRLRKATPQLFGLGIGALVLLVAFTVAVKAKEDKAPQVIVVPMITK